MSRSYTTFFIFIVVVSALESWGDPLNVESSGDGGYGYNGGSSCNDCSCITCGPGQECYMEPGSIFAKPKCRLKCGPNEAISMCEDTCVTKGKPTQRLCPDENICACKQGYVRDKQTRQCIPSDQCSSTTTHKPTGSTTTRLTGSTGTRTTRTGTSETPVTPKTPATPGTPTTARAPGTPRNPTTRATPGPRTTHRPPATPTTARTPGTSTTTRTPGTSGTPTTARSPKTTTIARAPGTPRTPTMPHIAGTRTTPRPPGTPTTARTPRTSTTARTPGTSRAPTPACTTGTPKTSTTARTPGTPGTPTTTRTLKTPTTARSPEAPRIPTTARTPGTSRTPTTATPKCCENEVLKQCSGCEATCAFPAGYPNCVPNCQQAKCECKPGFVRCSTSGKCVCASLCPKNSCPPNEDWNTCPTCEATCTNLNPICPMVCKTPACQCCKGYVRCPISGRCVTSASCPKVNPLTKPKAQMAAQIRPITVQVPKPVAQKQSAAPQKLILKVVVPQRRTPVG